MALNEYKKKRTFSNTPEPEGNVKPAGNAKGSKEADLLFVVQKHDASHLHYDLRLEVKGVMKSWAVPKGPSMNPADKRLAMLVEDHPIEYNEFEGVIPKGNYGAGTVIIWDRGTYEPFEEVPKGRSVTRSASGDRKKKLSRAEQEKLFTKEFYSGSVKIKLNGKKLKGEFALVKTSGRGENSWLLIKHRDEFATEEDITEEDQSVVSGKTIEQMASDKKSKQWVSNRSSNGKWKKENEKPTVSENRLTRKSKKDHDQAALKINGVEDSMDTIAKDYDKIVIEILASLGNKKKSAMPEDLRPMLATLIDEPFDNPDWLYEVKWDGYRTLAYLNKGKVELRSRNNISFIEKFYPVHNALKLWP
ncbi:MAG: DNA polymerase ligase N-terminal domain-containing protein, partial [Kaistella sp.]